MKSSCLACKKAVKVLDGLLVDHRPPVKSSWLITKDDVCAGSGVLPGSEHEQERLISFCDLTVSNIQDELEVYQGDIGTIMIEVRYKGGEDPDVPSGRFWEAYSVEDIVEESIGAGVTNYYVPMKQNSINMIKIGSESSLLPNSRTRAIDQKRLEYVRYLGKRMATISDLVEEISAMQNRIGHYS